MREMMDFILWIGAACGILNMIAYSRAGRLERQRKAEELRREVEARRRRNGSIAAINFKCGADIVRVDRETEMEFTPFVDGVWPKPLKESELFLRCINTCGKYSTCPILERLRDVNARHEFGSADGFAIVKSRSFDENGTAYLVFYEDSEERNFTVNGEAFHGNDNTLCFVRFSPHREPANSTDERTADGNEPTGDRKD